MNKTAIKNYAIWARVQLIESAKQRAYEYEITDGGENKGNLEAIGGRLLTKEEKEQRRQLIGEINQKGYTQVMEEAAYTWFNRFIALRFMEVNGYLPSKIRVFTDENGAFKPEILKEAVTVELEGLDRVKVLDLLDKQDNEALYKYLLITQCNALNSGLPYMFEKIANWTELLFPANLLRSDSVLGRMISDIPEEDWQDAVQIIGWLYQYYNSELKDETFALLKKNVKISKERIPAATQLFTPDWIVRYMVENSLGRLWVDHLKGDHESRFPMHTDDLDDETVRKINEIKSNWKYYLEEAKQEQTIESKLRVIRANSSELNPEDIKIIDPCMGSGHILVYAFDVLMQIYEAQGYTRHDAARLIVEKNLYGLDIDERAAQLAYFSVMMKARQYDRRFFSREISPNVLPIIDSSNIEFELEGSNFDSVHMATAKYLIDAFKDAKEYGALINIEECDYDGLEFYLEKMVELTNDEPNMLTLWWLNQFCNGMFALVQQAKILSQKYDVVVTNPPYMGSSGMSAKLSEFVKKNYPDSKSDLFAVFIERCGQMTKKNGYQAMITQHAWMFLSSFEKLRTKLLSVDIVNMAHLGARAFEEIGGEVVQTTSFVIRRSHIKDYKGLYCRLIEPSTQQGKEDMFLAGDNRYAADQSNFSKIPGSPVAYWVSEAFANMILNTVSLGKIAYSFQGIITGDNNYFLRQWYEITNLHMKTNISHEEGTIYSDIWVPYNKGGGYRRWYGNNEYLLRWIKQGKGLTRARSENRDYYFREGVTWSFITSGTFSCRYFPEGALWDVAGSSIFSIGNESIKYICGLMNSKVAQFFFDITNPTLNYQVMNIISLPYQHNNKNHIIERVSEKCISLSRIDWDSYETSWDFKRHPLLQYAAFTPQQIAQEEANGFLTTNGLVYAYRHWKRAVEERFVQLKANEEELNRIFIDIYGLQDELTPDVADKDITVHRVYDSKDDVPESMKGSNYARTMRDEIVSLISYAVGCMFGRYSLDVDGLAYAGGEWDASKYKTIIPDSDNIIPICDDEYFDDDITGRFVKWVEVVYGKETLEENLKFIADALGGKGTPREVIRGYFLNDFYADHLKTYQKRPIYWLFSSGKKNGFKALIYMHRYQSDLLARMRTDYVHEQQERYRTQLQMLEDSLTSAAPSERVKLNKQITKLKDQSLEIQKYEEEIHHLADQMISIDLDDGVKVNYAKFQDVLEKIK